MNIDQLNLNLWSGILGLIGSLLVFRYGIPPRIDKDGHIHLILEQTDTLEKKKAKRYLTLGKLGIILIAISFCLQIVRAL